jgi:Lipopolysaccharide-assembly
MCFLRACLKLPALCAVALLLAGCAGYHLGPVNDAMPGDKSVEVLPFNNQTLEPRLGDAVTQAVRERLQSDGTYRVVNGEGDVVVTGVITGYSRQGLSFLSSDVLTANNYQVGIVAHVVARDSVTGKVLLDKDVRGSTLVHVGSDLADAERQAMPLLAEDLAQNVTQMLAEETW